MKIFFLLHIISPCPFLLQVSSGGGQLWSCKAILWGFPSILARRSGLGLVGTLRLAINLIMVVCILNSYVVAAHCTSFDMNSEEEL